MSRALLIALGNPLRGDDGVAAYLAARFEGQADLLVRYANGLVPELSAELDGLDPVILIDADPQLTSPRLAEIQARSDRPWGATLTHHLSPAEWLALARQLYGFEGRAYLCHVPASDFDGEELSAAARAGADIAFQDLSVLLGRPRPDV